jgi:hypothetical protein
LSLGLKITLGTIMALTMLAGLGSWLVGLELVRAGVEPTAADGDLYAGWDALLARHVHPDGVDYDGLAAEEAALRGFVATLEGLGPKSNPDRFPTENDRLAYYINAYNALTLLGVIEHHPIDTIHDVRGRIEPTPGFGFFWGQRFKLDGRGLNLYDLENKIIRPKFGDARIHAAINCASGSCPTLSSRAYRPETLDAQLDAATRDFVGSDDHVRYGDGVVHLSSIFTWFAEDFEAHARGLDLPAHTLAFVEHYSADVGRREAAAKARAEGWSLEFMDYDWSLNRRP